MVFEPADKQRIKILTRNTSLASSKPGTGYATNNRGQLDPPEVQSSSTAARPFSYSDVLAGKCKAPPRVALVLDDVQQREQTDEGQEPPKEVGKRKKNKLLGSVAGPYNATEEATSTKLDRKLENVVLSKTSRNKPTPVESINLFDFISVSQPKPRNNEFAPNKIQTKVVTEEKPKKPERKTDVVNKTVVRKTDNNFGNLLDASAPLFHKGKTRDKTKKPTTLKKIVLQDRDTRCKLSEEEKLQLTKEVGPKKFRSYCDNVSTDLLDKATIAFLVEVKRFQDRLWSKDPDKARQKRRVVCGLHEVMKHLKAKNVKCLVIAPDLEVSQTHGGIDDKIREMVEICRTEGVAYLFAVDRHKLGHAVKKSCCSCVAVLNYQGAESLYKVMMEEHSKAFELFLTKASPLANTDQTADHTVEADAIQIASAQASNEHLALSLATMEIRGDSAWTEVAADSPRTGTRGDSPRTMKSLEDGPLTLETLGNGPPTETQGDSSQTPKMRGDRPQESEVPERSQAPQTPKSTHGSFTSLHRQMAQVSCTSFDTSAPPPGAQEASLHMYANAPPPVPAWYHRHPMGPPPTYYHAPPPPLVSARQPFRSPLWVPFHRPPPPPQSASPSQPFYSWHADGRWQ